LALPALLLPLTLEPSRSALFLDFDGTLSAIVDDPVAARPLPGVPELLGRLASRLGLVAVVSGRPTTFLADVLSSPPHVTLVGLYGLELGLPEDQLGPWAAAIAKVAVEATEEAPAGVYVEPKGLTVTLHWRHAPAASPWADAFARRQHAQRGLREHRGRMSLELGPPIDVDKGTVVRTLAARLARPLRAVGVFGDDLGDLPAFAAVGDLAGDRAGEPAVVRVAVVDAESPPEVAARADLTVAGAPAAVALLEELARELAQAAG
jgi:trehalose 6-phosphate phosphatase